MNHSSEQAVALNLEQLKMQLEKFCQEHSITKFEPDEIFELIEDGEEVDWLMEQIGSETETLPTDELKNLLDNIKQRVHPEAGEIGLEIPPAAEEIEAPPEEVPPDFDLSEMELPEGFKLPPGMNMESVQKLMNSPQGAFLADFSLFCQEKGFLPEMTDKSSQQQIKQYQQEWLTTQRPAFEGKTPQQMMEENPELMTPGKVETYRREQPKIGRNDPCPCGSGKKYKKCCGKGA